MSLITLTTDFGLRDWFVGTMKGVIAGIAPRASVIDLTHDIPPGDIQSGAFALAAGCRYFPKGTVHVAVVDPGVGSRRRAIAVKTTNYLFVGPDNGVLSFALRKQRIKNIRLIENQDLFLHPVSRTFHGRDIFSPVAAHLSAGLPFSKLGPVLEKYTQLSWPEPRFGKARVEGEVIYLDRFGNAITNLDAESLRTLDAASLEVHTLGRCLCPIAEFYQAVPAGKPVAVIGSSGLLELAVNGGSAKKILRLKIGTPITVSPLSPSD